jgi:hypothetical protein
MRFEVVKQMLIHFSNPISVCHVYLCLHELNSFCEHLRISTNVPITIKTQTNFYQLTRYIYCKHKYCLPLYRTVW